MSCVLCFAQLHIIDWVIRIGSYLLLYLTSYDLVTFVCYTGHVKPRHTLLQQ